MSEDLAQPDATPGAPETTEAQTPQDEPGAAVLQRFNAASEQLAAAMILPCNGSMAWAMGMVLERPYDDAATLLMVSDDVWRGLGLDAWQEAFDSHPRIGERKASAATAQSLAWSDGEQAAAQGEAAAQTALAEGNAAYEARFGRIFLICATGRSAGEILSEMRRRMGNDDTAELQEAAEQQRQITALRLRKWLRMEAAE